MFKIGDKIKHKQTGDSIYTVVNVTLDGVESVITCTQDQTGQRAAFFARQCYLVNVKPIGSFITW